jgi:hypothetical protein
VLQKRISAHGKEDNNKKKSATNELHGKSFDDKSTLFSLQCGTTTRLEL